MPRQHQQLLLLVLLVGHVHGHEEGRRGDKDELQGPQTDVGDGEEVVIADTVAARLLGVAGEGGFLVPPDALSCHHQHHYPEYEDDREPDAPNGSGVAVHSTQHRVEAGPVHCSSRLQEQAVRNSVRSRTVLGAGRAPG
uniref:Secreted protein n=1 Tax=Aquila chrysaetos chrysaetos TaxID=223781 RepID=A0A663FAF3_AQUCH